MSVLLEACCASVEEAVAAQAGGADRIELCAALPTGGVTPSPGMIEEARARIDLPIVAMVRPREGGPDWPDPDFRAAVRDVRRCFEAGADEVITGVLGHGLTIDVSRNRELVEAAEGRPVAFHRVFDMTPDPDTALDALIGLGFVRVLTSGCPTTVDEGITGLTRLVRRSSGRLTVLAGGGVREHNARRLVEECGCQELHFSFRRATGFPSYGGIEDFQAVPSRIAAVRTAIGA
ncbi:MAG: copper homeostasis protein CutC [Armatimonadetes bacterium]|nr:copper homeostasis protein CutC [Armatimonadota bacterium]